MSSKHPSIYEINTWVWLGELSRRHKHAITLATVPHEEWDALASWGVDAVWFMGVWERSPMGRAIAAGCKDLMAAFRRVLPDFKDADLVGSPYCVHRYVVDAHLGGPDGLAAARRELANRNIRLILDYVPNHVAPDHPWVKEHPDYFVRGTLGDLARDPDAFIEIENVVFARARDPNFPPWKDLLQLNALHAGLRRAACATLLDIAGQCDGVRCDMAMLVMNEVFTRIWGLSVREHPNADFWPEAISTVEEVYPEFMFIAEVYWGLEFRLMQQGFDFCYDKTLYDRLRERNVAAVKDLLRAHRFYQDRLLRFIENHDEPRAATALGGVQSRAAAIVAATLPGATLFHEGQFEGRKVQLPVQLTRRPEEPLDEGLRKFYRVLLEVVRATGKKDGEWQVCERYGWPDNTSYLNILAWSWRHCETRYLIVVNFSAAPAQAQIRVPWDDLKARTWQLHEVFTEVVYERFGGEMCAVGLYVDLPPWGYHVLRAGY